MNGYPQNNRRLFCGTTNQAATADGVNVIDDHLEGDVAVLDLSSLSQLVVVESLQVVCEGQVACVQDTNSAVVVTSGQHQAGIALSGTEGDIDDTGVDTCDGTQDDIAVAQLDAAVEDAPQKLQHHLILYEFHQNQKVDYLKLQ